MNKAKVEDYGRLDAAGLHVFVEESNRIEGIMREPTRLEIEAHRTFLHLGEVTWGDLIVFVELVANALPRNQRGLNVRVGNHRPLPGGPGVETAVQGLLRDIRVGALTPYEAHTRYELLHPFLDGNGRSGRVLWAWQMLRAGQDPFALPFLHRFYYQALDAARKPAEAESRSSNPNPTPTQGAEK